MPAFGEAGMGCRRPPRAAGGEGNLPMRPPTLAPFAATPGNAGDHR
jgi:hypothetical protein